MRRSRQYWVLLVVLLVLSVSSSSSARKKSRGGGGRAPTFHRGGIKRPSGWDQGKKKGWNSDVPPGIEKKGDWRPSGLDKAKDDKPPGLEKKAEDKLSKPDKIILPLKEEKKVEKELKQKLPSPKTEKKLQDNTDEKK